MANQITVNSGSGNITVTTSRAVIGTVANVASANYANFAGEAFSVDAANIVGPVPTAATVTTNAQPNITSVGNLTSLNVTGTATTGNLVVTGNLQVGNLVANSANYANFAGNAFAVAGANVSGTVANATFATTAGSANTANSATVANSANTVAGANVSGTVANATFATTAGSANTANSATVASSANSVTLANVSGAGNIASINLDGSTSNVLYGNGIFAPAAGGNTANANYANFAGNAFSVDGGNVVGAVANATFALDAGNANIANIAYSVDGANVSGAVANATFALDAGNANIANIAYSVDGANVSGTVANATFSLDAGNANIANIAYSVDGANVSGAVANATFALDAGNANIANIAYSVDAANVSGLGNIATINLDGNASNLLDGTGNWVAIPAAANANFANFAGEVTNSAQPNITSVGNLTALTVNTNSAINVTTSNSNIILTTNNSSNTANLDVRLVYQNPVTNNAVALNAGEGGFGYYISNTAPGNVGTGNIRSYWQFLTNGDFRHTLGGTGNVIAKNLILANAFTGSVIGNVNAGNVIANAGIISATGAGFVGNATGLTNIPGANVTGTVANATYAADAGNANIANIAYSVDAANVSGLGNIATINLDGNASNFLDGTGNFVAAPGGANANYANFAGTVLTNAQPNITSVGTLTGLITAATSNVTIEALNNNALLKVTANANGFGTQQNYTGTHIEQQTQAGASEAGFTITTANTNPGNSFPSNLKGVWRFDSTGNLAHLIGGTGAIVAKQGVFGTGNVSAGNVVLSTNSSSAPLNVTQQGAGGISAYNMHTNTSVFTVQNFYRTRGNTAAKTAVGTNDTVFTQNYSAYGDSGNQFVTLGYQENKVGTNSGNAISLVTTFNATHPGSSFTVAGYDTVALNGNITAGNLTGNIVTANYFYGDGSNITGITVGAGTSIVNGNSNVVVNANSNVTVSTNGTANVMVINSGAVQTTGHIAAGVSNISYSDLANTYFLSGTEAQGIHFTVGTAPAGTLTINASNVAQNGYSRTHYVYITNNTGNTLDVATTGSQEDLAFPLNISPGDSLSFNIYSVNQFVSCRRQ